MPKTRRCARGCQFVDQTGTQAGVVPIMVVEWHSERLNETTALAYRHDNHPMLHAAQVGPRLAIL